MPLLAKLPRDHKFTLGDRILARLLDVQECCVLAYYGRDKAGPLTEANLQLEMGRHLARLAHDLRLVSYHQYEVLAGKMEEVGRMLRTILAETPLVRNLQNPHYMKILLNDKSSLEEVFAEIEIDTLRKTFREAQDDPERIPAKLKPVIAMPDFPEKLVSLVEKAVA